MDFQAELAAIFAGIESLEATAKEFSDVATAIEVALPASNRSSFETLLKSAAMEAVALAHGDSPLAKNMRADLKGGLMKLGHLVGHMARDVADAVDPTSVDTTKQADTSAATGSAPASGVATTANEPAKK